MRTLKTLSSLLSSQNFAILPWTAMRENLVSKAIGSQCIAMHRESQLQCIYMYTGENVLVIWKQFFGLHIVNLKISNI